MDGLKEIIKEYMKTHFKLVILCTFALLGWSLLLLLVIGAMFFGGGVVCINYNYQNEGYFDLILHFLVFFGLIYLSFDLLKKR